MRTRLLAVSALTGAAALAASLLPGSATAAPFLAPVVVSGVDASEPEITIAPDGTIYISAPGGIGSKLPFSPSYVWRSTDSGTTWTQTPFGLRGDASGGGDSDITVAPDGKLAMTDLWLGSSTVSTSADKGQTWLTNTLQGVVGQDRQWVAAVGGLTYPTHVIAATPLDQTGCVCPPGNMIAEPGAPVVAGQQATSVSDKVGVIYYTSTGGVKFARSVNSGATWTQATVKPASSLDTGRAFPVVANGGNGFLAAVWQEQSGSTSNVGFSYSTNWGSTWSTPQVIVSTGSSVFPWVDARGGKIGVSLFHTSANGVPDGVPNSAQWFETYLESTTSAPTTWSALQTADATAVKTGPICTNGIDCSGDRELGDFQSIAFDASLRPNLAYARSVNGSTDTEIRFVRQ